MCLPNMPMPTLTPREREILHLIAAGLTNQQITAQLWISHNTFKTHRRRIYRKLGIKHNHRAAAFRLAQAIDNRQSQK